MQRTLFYILISYCFLFGIPAREIGGFPFGIVIEILILIILFLNTIKSKKEDWSLLKVDLFYLWIGWLFLSILEVLNPGASTLGWISELRSAALYPLLIIILAFLNLRSLRDLDHFLVLIISLSTIAALNGFKQLHFGLSNGEQAFLLENSSTHLLWGRLRVFSIYSDAGQFGASQAHIGLIGVILLFAPMKTWKRGLLIGCSILNIYGMLISGTRGALFVIIVGAFLALILSKNLKAVLLGGMVVVSLLLVLKFTQLGNSNYEIYRLRSALNPQDASLNVRLQTQKNLRVYMADLPFGGGLGVTGYNGSLYNPDKYLANIPPDSYFVKIWMMYGIVGLTIWLGVMLYILGKCCGLVWHIKDKGLKIKLIALTAGFGGILFCTYGNEVINTMPTSIVIYVSWVFIFFATKLDKETSSLKNKLYAI